LTDVRKLIGKKEGDYSATEFKTQPLKVLSAHDFLTDEVLPPPAPAGASSTTEITASDAGGNAPSTAAPAGNVPKFTVLKGVAAPLHMANVDTDMIIPKQFLKTLKRTGLGGALFHTLRTDPRTGKRTDFVLNREPYDHASILVCDGANFGCGSSREHAPWSL